MSFTSEEMLISIIVPVYNAAAFLPECLKSLQSQTAKNYEIILVDDGSTDDSGAICDSFVRANGNAHVVHIVNQGPFLARREGVRRSHGAYLMFVDADDCLRADAVERVTESICETGSDIICFDYARGKEPTYENGCFHVAGFEPGLYNGIDYAEVKRALCTGYFNNLATKAVKNSLIDVNADSSQWKGIRHGEDLLQLIPIIESAHSLLYLPEVLYFYRENPQSGTAQFQESQIDDLGQVFDVLSEMASSWGSDYKGQAEELVCRHCFWLLENLAETKNPLEYKVNKMQDIRQLMETHCGQRIPKSIGYGRSIVLQALIRQKWSQALALASGSNMLYRAKRRVLGH